MSAPFQFSSHEPDDLGPIREEIASQLARVAAHAAAAASHAQAGADHAVAFEVRCAAAAMLSVAGLVGELRPSRRGERAA